MTEIVLTKEGLEACNKLCNFMVEHNKNRTTDNARTTRIIAEKRLEKLRTGSVSINEANWLKTNFGFWRDTLKLSTPPEIEDAGKIKVNYYDPWEELIELPPENKEKKYVTWDELEVFAEALLKFIKERK